MVLQARTVELRTFILLMQRIIRVLMNDPKRGPKYRDIVVVITDKEKALTLLHLS